MVAPLGPVVTGRLVVSRFMVGALREAGVEVDEADVGPRSRHPWARLRRPPAFAAAAARLVADRGPDVRAVYLAVDAGRAMDLNAATAAAARLAGRAVVLHHHSYLYVRRHRPRAARLLRAAGPDALHIVNCPSMGAGLARHYGLGADRVVVLSNVVTVPAPAEPLRRPGPNPPGAPVVLGFLGNVSREKGLDEAVATAVVVARRCPGSRLVVAGPCQDRAGRAVLRRAMADHPELVEYRGPVYGGAKAAFFAAIDVFLFPSAHPGETQGVVNFEALAHGVPVVARELGCVGEDLSAAPGLVVPAGVDFPAAAGEAIVALAGSGRLGRLRGEASDHFLALRSGAEPQLGQAVAALAALTA